MQKMHTHTHTQLWLTFTYSEGCCNLFRILCSTVHALIVHLWFISVRTNFLWVRTILCACALSPTCVWKSLLWGGPGYAILLALILVSHNADCLPSTYTQLFSLYRIINARYRQCLSVCLVCHAFFIDRKCMIVHVFMLMRLLESTTV